MIHLFFRQPWIKLLKHEQPLCRILNPVIKSVKNVDGVCIACLDISMNDDINLVAWHKQLKKEKKKNV